ncbi:hypothetical protein [Sinorhizobium sp. GL28]|nr:hypothetical protein [Sinorhizobium sp. GL28]KSV93565.1 hypothetical protein N184_04350 [Sinorhizobium sp. GL28]
MIFSFPAQEPGAELEETTRRPNFKITNLNGDGSQNQDRPARKRRVPAG